ncbi:MAG: PstS family phosphate ABC transporter substrate-binding protein [Candidatus Marinimicrobia bacterium]|nr:PstS family phosphate ABC transporter substrate-binding protein [Candidatus Neomarinimicrobiota bacterium]
MKNISIILLLTIMVFTGCNSGKSNAKAHSSLTIKGSDTMVHLASNWAESYMNSYKDADISVTGGGSGTGIAALLNGTTDICIASRKIKDKEVKQAEKQGLDINEIIVSRDGIAVVINPENPVSELTLEQIGKIYTGATTNWNQVGGSDAPIVLLSRESSSGTYVFFQKRVMNKKDYSQEAMLMPSTSAIVQSVSQDQWAIGYVGLGYAVEAADRVKPIQILNKAGLSPVNASVKTVKNGSYPIARPLHFYTNGDPVGLEKQFIEFCLSDAGQTIVFETGYVPVN